MDPAPEVQITSSVSTSEPLPVAPQWHSLLLVCFIVLLSALGSNSQHSVGKSHRELLYVTTIIIEWLMFAYTYWSIRRSRRATVREVIGGRWQTPEDFLIDIAFAAGFWVVAVLVLAGLAYGMGLSGPGKAEEAKKVLSFLAPQTVREAVLFGVLCITAGFCEEFIFRGYFQRQFAAAAKNVYVGIAGSAIIFGLGHGYEGVKRMFLIAVYGLMFGLLAHFRKSLRPGMIAHAWHDGFTGAMLYLASKVKLP
jgi:membrane protease YdiL (CAAX protease family)